MKKLNFGFTIVVFIIEILLAIPLLGAAIVVGSVYTALLLTFTLHLTVLVLRIVSNKKSENSTNLPIAAPIVGLVGSSIAWIPFVGWSVHIATAILYLIELANSKLK